MTRILDIDLPLNKKIYLSLSSIYGIGVIRAIEILRKLNIDIFKLTSQLSSEENSMLKDFIENSNFLLGEDLKKEKKEHILHLININSYRGKRHLKCLPVRGQRTRTNHKTIKKFSLNLSKK